MRSRLLDETQLNPSQQNIVKDFERLKEDSRLAVADFNGERKPQSGSKLLAEISALKQHDPQEFETMKKALTELVSDQ